MRVELLRPEARLLLLLLQLLLLAPTRPLHLAARLLPSTQPRPPGLPAARRLLAA